MPGQDGMRGVDLAVAQHKGMVAGKKAGPFEWTSNAEHAFRMIKDYFTTAPTLAHFDPERQSRVEVDASGEAIGGVLQVSPGTRIVMLVVPM